MIITLDRGQLGVYWSNGDITKANYDKGKHRSWDGHQTGKPRDVGLGQQKGQRQFGQHKEQPKGQDHGTRAQSGLTGQGTRGWTTGTVLLEGS